MYSTSFASPLTWTVDGSFDNGATLTGTFDYDATSGAVSNWDLTGASGYAYTPADSLFQAGACCTDQTAFIFTTFDSVLSLEVAFNPDLTNDGGTSSIAGGSETYQLVDKPPVIALLTGGDATTSSVGPGPVAPEPATYAYLVIGLAFVTLSSYRRRSGKRIGARALIHPRKDPQNL